MSRALIIAEVGVNHNGDINNAKELIIAASNCGADIVKFQSFKTEKLVTALAQKTKYQIENTNKFSITQKDMLSRLELTDKDHQVLFEFSRKNKIEFLSTAFDIESLQMLLDLGIKRIKIPSGEITNLPYLRKISSINLPIILSTGMSNINEVNDALNILTESGRDKNSITLLHCSSEYPAPYEGVNLKAMNKIKEIFNIEIGYSDHTIGIEIPLAAASLGAKIIEKHITLDKYQNGPDHKASLEPKEFAMMVKGIRVIEKSLGSETKKPSKNEIENSLLVRKSIVAARKIKLGEVFTNDNLTCKRPFNGLSPMKWDEIIGQNSKKNYEKDDPIE